jgi:DNA-directed RNA polymerase subunit RPC12/RpoP
MRSPPKPIHKLSDEFGNFVLTIRCMKCGHTREGDTFALARLVGWNASLDSIARRMRCSVCDHKIVSVEGRKAPRRKRIELDPPR